jgi:hypothetical protein
MRSFWRKSARRRRSRGQALAEMAIAVPVFVLVMIAIIEGGAFALTVTTVEHATQRGGRAAALDPCPPSTPLCSPGRMSETDVKNLVINEASIAALTVVPGDITITIECDASPCNSFTNRVAGERVRVVTSVTYRPITALVFGGSAAFPMTLSTVYTVE